MKYRDANRQVKRKTPKGAKYQAHTSAGEKARRDAAIRMHNKLQREAWAVEEGYAKPKRGVPVRDAEAAYYETVGNLSTEATYREGTGPFMAYLAKKGVRTGDQLSRRLLTAFRQTLVSRDHSPHTINKRLRSVKTMLRHWVIDQEATTLGLEDILVLKSVRAPVELKEYLKLKQVQQTLRAAVQHDDATYSMTRREKAGEVGKGGTCRYEAIAPFVLFTLLTGCRRGEALRLRWRDVDLDHETREGVVGAFYVRAAESKTKRARRVTMAVSPLLRRLLVAQKVRTGGHPSDRVWKDLTEDVAVKAKLRMRKSFGAPREFSWQACRRTTSTFLVNSGVFASPVFQSAAQLGHDLRTMEKHYAGLEEGIDPSLRTLEEVLRVAKIGNEIVSSGGDASHDRAPVSRIGGSSKS